jgi:hypothetical protein
MVGGWRYSVSYRERVVQKAYTVRWPRVTVEPA